VTQVQLDAAIVLAAGEGTRMKSQTPKVMHRIAGRTIIEHVLTQVNYLKPTEVRVVIGAGRDVVEPHIKEISPKAIAVFQAERNGTGHAVQLALAELNSKGTVLIVAGDTPLLRNETLTEFIAAHIAGKNQLSVLTAELPDPTGYGRIIRDAAGAIIEIVEERDASDELKMIDEINTGVYLFDIPTLKENIKKIKSNNSQGELYLTDVIAEITKSGGKSAAILSLDYSETLGINDRTQLAESAALMRDRINDRHMQAGVTIIDPTTTWIDAGVVIESDVTIQPGSWLSGNTKVAQGAVIGPRTTLKDVIVKEKATIVESNVSGSEIGCNANVGPFSFIRPGTKLADNSKVGAYVEVKNSQIGEGSKVPHLSYVGDAEIGSGTNIGAATVFVNYDGEAKHETKIGDDVRIGSDTMLVAPVTIGDGAYTAAGSVITENVPAGAIGVARSKQRNILGWVLRRRAGTKSAESAKKAGATEN
jgi:bifunctional UDP-N-acetylglucosamine pyrophosphorylase / glucosamine-1-phosphate N-acetyltransferase